MQGKIMKQVKSFAPLLIPPVLYTLGMGVANFCVHQLHHVNYGDSGYIRFALPFLTALAAVTVPLCLTQRQARRERDSGRILLFLLLFLPLAGMTLYYWASNGSLSAAFALPLATTLLVGIGEELMFRRFLFDGLLRRGQSFIAALLLSAFLFSLLHSVNVLAGLPFRQMLVQLGTTFLAGLFYALLYDYTKNIFLMIALHWLWDYLLLSGAVQAIPAFGIILPALNVVEILLIPVLLFLRRQAEKARQGGGV